VCIYIGIYIGIYPIHPNLFSTPSARHSTSTQNQSLFSSLVPLSLYTAERCALADHAHHRPSSFYPPTMAVLLQVLLLQVLLLQVLLLQVLLL
jgi:hypothetical protein